MHIAFIDNERIELQAAQAAENEGKVEFDDEGELQIERYKLVDKVEFGLTEAKIVQKFTSVDYGIDAAEGQPKPDGTTEPAEAASPPTMMFTSMASGSCSLPLLTPARGG